MKRAPVIVLREVIDRDLPVFYEQQLDPDAVHMAAFTSRDPADRAVFDAHWRRIRADKDVTIRTIVVEGRVAGTVLSYVQSGRTEVSYWIGKEHWGRGIATEALDRFLSLAVSRPLYARAAKDNIASLRVLEKCGFSVVGEDRGFANARGEEIEELILRLDAPSRDKPKEDRP